MVEASLVRFVRDLLGGQPATPDGDQFVSGSGRRAGVSEVLPLIRSGALEGNENICRANSGTRTWLRRVQLETNAFAEQHRHVETAPNGTVVNLMESPLAHLATAAGGRPAFLGPHHVEAGERVRRLVDRAQLQPRLTMSYSSTKTAGTRQTAADISDLAADARRAIAEIHGLLPSDCAGVVIDVCGLLKGLQEIERARGWPRRSAKLVLRIGLDQLAQHYGLGPMALGRGTTRSRTWMSEGARPNRFA
jgi:hypothetical protein